MPVCAISHDHHWATSLPALEWSAQRRIPLSDPAPWFPLGRTKALTSGARTPRSTIRAHLVPGRKLECLNSDIIGEKNVDHWLNQDFYRIKRKKTLRERFLQLEDILCSAILLKERERICHIRCKNIIERKVADTCDIEMKIKMDDVVGNFLNQKEKKKKKSIMN